MATSKQSSRRIRPSAEPIVEALQTFARWWTGELLNLFPPRMAQRLSDAGNRTLLARRQGADVELLLRNESGDVMARTMLPDIVDMRGAIDAFLREQGRPANDVAIGIELPAGALFRREILLPREAGRNLAQVAEQDLLRKTPFRLEDIHHDYVARDEGAKLVVTQIVVRRALVEEAASAPGLPGSDLAFVETAASTGEGQPTILRLSRVTKSAAWLPKAALGLAATALLFLGIAAWLEAQRQAAVLAELDAQLVKARAQAQQARSAADKAQQDRSAVDRLRARKGEAASTLDIWEEISRVLPDNSWLTELRIAESPDRKDRKIVITGFSAAAADLVAIIDTSPMFQDVALTAPIAVDPAEQRERFVLQAGIDNAPGGGRR